MIAVFWIIVAWVLIGIAFYIWVEKIGAFTEAIKTLPIYTDYQCRNAVAVMMATLVIGWPAIMLIAAVRVVSESRKRLGEIRVLYKRINGIKKATKNLDKSYRS